MHYVSLLSFPFLCLSLSSLRAQVSSIYADASIGNSIKIAVVHIMYIEQDLVTDATSNGKFEKHSFDQQLQPADSSIYSSSSSSSSLSSLLLSLPLI